ncbi:MAG: efflux RND transporter periplasmic adaptor subunit [Pseudomonadota bacterium]
MEPLPGAPAVATPSPPGSRPPLSRRARWIGGLAALVLLAGLGWLAWVLTHPSREGAAAGGGERGAGGRRGGGTTTVGVAAAERADLPVVLEALGTVTPAATVTVRPQVSGVLQQLLFREGQTVQAGQRLAQIDPRPFEMALMQATGQRQRDEAQLDAARVTLARFRTLLEQDSIARQEVDTQAALVKQLEGTLATNRANEGTARLNLGYTRVVAPISGRLGLRVVDVGNVVSSGDAAGLAVITQLAPIDVQFAVPQDRVPEFQAPSGVPGAPGSPPSPALPVTVLDRARTATLATGTFTALDNLVDTQTGTVRAKARFANETQALFPSQFVNVRVQLRTIKQAVVVPVSALRHSSSGDFVYVLKPAERTVALRPVQRGQATVDKVEVVSGLQAGEQVITEGGDRLKDGARVALPGDNPASAPGGGRRGERGPRGAAASAPVAPAASGAEAPAAEAAASAPADAASRPRGQRRSAETATPP